MAKREVIELLKKYIFLLNSEGVGVSKAFLYGSYLTDSATDDSDIDVLIVSDKYDESDDLIAGKVWKLTKNISTKIEPYLVGVKKFQEDNGSPLLTFIKEKGIEVA